MRAPLHHHLFDERRHALAEDGEALVLGLASWVIDSGTTVMGGRYS